jgi:hypothetical protein
MSHNQLSNVTLDERIDKKQVKYTNKDFSDFKKNLVEFTKFYFTDTYQDFSDASPGSIFLDLASYVGDVLSYYTDHSFKESLLAYAEEPENIVSLAQGFGYKPQLVMPASCVVSMSALIPADTVGSLDTKYLPRFSAGTSFTATTETDSGTFITQDICDFGNAIDRDVRPFALDSNTDLPSSYVVSKPIKTVGVIEKDFKMILGSPEKYLKIELPEDDIVDIKSVTDSEGNTWHQVDNLSQDYVFQDTLVNITDASVMPLYSIRTVKVNRRFVVRVNRDMKTELVFGSGLGDLSDIYQEPDYRTVYDENYLQNMTNVALDTINFTTGNSFGLAPGDTTLTITYRKATGLAANVSAGTITKINNLVTVNETSIFTVAEQTVWDAVVSSVSVVNEEAARGGGGAPTVEQIRHSAIGYINAQRRVVTTSDYEKRVLSMPEKYGAVAKSFVMKDDAITATLNLEQYVEIPHWRTLDPEDDIQFVHNRPLNTNINLYVLGLDSNKRLTTLNGTIKSNIKQFLKGYRMITDRINILDAFRVSIGVHYTIVVYKGHMTADVLVRCHDTIRKYFNIDRWQINQPLLKDDLLVEIAKVDGVQSIPELSFSNKYQQRDGSDYATYTYDLVANERDRVIYPSVDPCIFEIRYPQTDIVGTAVQ